MLPYIFCIVLGLSLYWFFRKRITKKWLRITSVLLIAIPFAIYFAINPIYEGDFSNQYRTAKPTQELDLENNTLTVVAIAGCPYCYESLNDLKLMKSRTDCEKINFMVYTKDSLNIEWYQEQAGGEVDVIYKPEKDDLFELSNGRFPTFVIQADEEIRIWNNNGFGVLAKDWIEDRFQ